MQLISIILIVAKLNSIFKKLSDKEEFDEILKEFNKNNLSSVLYYILFILRRILQSFLIVFINIPILQVTVSLVLGLCVNFI